MQKLRYVGLDAPLSTEQGQYLQNRAYMIARQTLQGRKLFGNSIIGPLGVGAESYAYDTLSEMSAARTDINWSSGNSLDNIDLSRTVKAMLTTHKEFAIDRKKLNASLMYGTPLETANVDSATYKVALAEDVNLIKGFSRDGTVIDVVGLYEAAKASGNTDSANYDWATPTDIPLAINAAIALMEADNIFGPYNLTVPAEQMGYMRVIMPYSSLTYLDWVKATVGGMVLTSNALTTGTGLLSKADPVGLFELVLGEELTVLTEPRSLERGGGIFGKVFTTYIPVIHDANALCAIQNIT